MGTIGLQRLGVIPGPRKGFHREQMKNPRTTNISAGMKKYAG